MYILNMMFVLYFQGFVQKFVLYYILEQSLKSFMEWLLSYVDMQCVYLYRVVCFRQGPKVEHFHWLVIPCIIWRKKYDIYQEFMLKSKLRVCGQQDMFIRQRWWISTTPLYTCVLLLTNLKRNVAVHEYFNNPVHNR